MSQVLKRGRNFRDKTNKRYGKLVALRPREDKKCYGEAIWICECDCGNICEVRSSSLTTKDTKSCGCLKSSNENKIRRMYVGGLSGSFWGQIKYSAKIRNVELSITQEQAWNLFLEQNGKCALSGVDIVLETKIKYRKLRTASLDRIDSTKGYTIDNVQWIHRELQPMKWKYDQEKFLRWVWLIYNSSIVGTGKDASSDRSLRTG